MADLVSEASPFLGLQIPPAHCVLPWWREKALMSLLMRTQLYQMSASALLLLATFSQA